MHDDQQHRRSYYVPIKCTGPSKMSPLFQRFLHHSKNLLSFNFLNIIYMEMLRWQRGTIFSKMALYSLRCSFVLLFQSRSEVRCRSIFSSKVTVWAIRLQWTCLRSPSYIGSISPQYTSRCATTVQIWYVVRDGSSQWFYGHNVTKYRNICRTSSLARFLKIDNSDSIEFAHDKHDHWRYFGSVSTVLKISGTAIENVISADMTSVVGSTSSFKFPWSDTRAIVDREQLDVCGYSDCSNIKMLLSRNYSWCYIVFSSRRFKMICSQRWYTTVLLQPSWRECTCPINRTYDDAVCIDLLLSGLTIWRKYQTVEPDPWLESYVKVLLSVIDNTRSIYPGLLFLGLHI